MLDISDRMRIGTSILTLAADLKTYYFYAFIFQKCTNLKNDCNNGRTLKKNTKPLLIYHDNDEMHVQVVLPQFWASTTSFFHLKSTGF